MRTSRIAGRLAALALCAVASACGSQHGEDAGDGEKLAHRARQVAAAWDGSAAATEWRAGYHPMGDVVQLPRGGLHGSADERSYRNRDFVLRGTLPAARADDGRVEWAGGEALTRPLRGATASYKALAGEEAVGRPHLTVTGAKPGKMTLATTRGPAVVPAWLFTLDGYDTPLKLAAVTPSKLPRPPIGPTADVPGSPLRNLTRIAADGRSVRVVALHGACDHGAKVDVLETRGSVVLTSSVRHPQYKGNCTKEALMQQVTAKLDRPLANRVLLDAITGRPVPYRPPFGPSPSWS